MGTRLLPLMLLLAYPAYAQTGQDLLPPVAVIVAIIAVIVLGWIYYHGQHHLKKAVDAKSTL